MEPGRTSGAGAVGDHDAAGLGLPPVVVEGLAEDLLAPDHGLGVQRLAHEARKVSDEKS
jgi:hypothetical protein